MKILDGTSGATLHGRQVEEPLKSKMYRDGKEHIEKLCREMLANKYLFDAFLVLVENMLSDHDSLDYLSLLMLRSTVTKIPEEYSKRMPLLFVIEERMRQGF